MDTLRCYDSFGNSITHFTQWDVNQIITVKDLDFEGTPIFQFGNKNYNYTIGVTPTIDENGIITVSVPNFLLQEAVILEVYLYIKNNEIGTTIYKARIGVREKPKPTDYEYTDNVDVVYIEEVVERIKELETKLQNAVDDVTAKLENGDFNGQDAVIDMELSENSNNAIANSVVTSRFSTLNSSIENINKTIDDFILKPIPTYGVCRDINSHSPTLKRVGDAVGLVANAGVGSETVRNDFDNIYPWCEMRKCTLADDGTVTSYFGDANYIEDGSIGQVMVEIPKYYYAHYYDEPEAHEYWYISKEKINSKYRLPQPFIAKDGTELDKIYIGAYFAESEPLEPPEGYKAKSISGNVYFGITMTLASAIANAENRGKNWHNIDISEWCDVIQPLFIVEFATLDSQSVMFGAPDGFDGGGAYCSANLCWGDKTDTVTEIIGNTFYSDDCNTFVIGQEIAIPTEAEYVTGEIDDAENDYAIRNVTEIEEIFDNDGVTLLGKKFTFDGTPIKITNESDVYINSFRCGATYKVKASSGSTVGLEGQCNMVYRGLENIYGCHRCWAAGLLLNNQGMYASNDMLLYDSTPNSSYSLCSQAMPGNGFVSEMKNIDFPWLYMPTEIEGTSESDYCDYIVSVVSGNFKGVTIGHTSVNETTGFTRTGIFALYFNLASSKNTAISRIAYRAYS